MMTLPTTTGRPGPELLIATMIGFLAPAAATALLVGALPIVLDAREYARAGEVVAFGEPIALVCAVVAAVWAAARLGRSSRTWLIAGVSLLACIVMLWFFHADGYSAPLGAGAYLGLRAASAILAGVVIGAVFSRAWSFPSAAPALAATAGVLAPILLSGFISGAASGIYLEGRLLAAGTVATSLTWTLLALGLAAVTAGLILDPPRPTGSSHALAGPWLREMLLLAGGLGAAQIVAIALVAEASRGWPMLARFAAAMAAVALVILAHWLVALRLALTNSPWAGAALLVMVAFTAAAAPVISQVPRIGIAWAAPVALLLVAGLGIGVILRHSSYHVLNGLLILAAVPVIGVIAGASGAAIIGQLLMIALGTGIALGSALPGAGPSGVVLAVLVPLMSLTIIALVSQPLFLGAIPSATVRAASDLPALWFQVIPTSSGSIIAVSVVGLCGAGILGIAYGSLRWAGAKPVEPLD
ncbi:hypothetical protein HT102_12880 [Hoyosella sp. G463]|uniref:Uncharacterized protein n=1 Tax=Lolliginicoccus lacisalsi TaxID=2742202 RepID=A0A927JE56_9ACTN|nr:hypothetical protein [Lolliginicoccus lacisalsi]MBD8507376.1 hypothetical protein [Lolliginicoccus lacisalsi]